MGSTVMAKGLVALLGLVVVVDAQPSCTDIYDGSSVVFDCEGRELHPEAGMIYCEALGCTPAECCIEPHPAGEPYDDHYYEPHPAGEPYDDHYYEPHPAGEPYDDLPPTYEEPRPAAEPGVGEEDCSAHFDGTQASCASDKGCEYAPAGEAGPASCKKLDQCRALGWDAPAAYSISNPWATDVHSLGDVTCNYIFEDWGSPSVLINPFNTGHNVSVQCVAGFFEFSGCIDLDSEGECTVPDSYPHHVDPAQLTNNIECLNRNLSWVPVDKTDPLFIINQTYPECRPQVDECAMCGDACNRTVPASSAQCTGGPACAAIDTANEVAAAACMSIPACTWVPSVDSKLELSSCKLEMATSARLGGIVPQSSNQALALSGCMCGAPTIDTMRRYCPWETQECLLDSMCSLELAAFAGCASFEAAHEFSRPARAVHTCATAALSAPPCTAADNCVGCSAVLFQASDYVGAQTPGFCMTEPELQCAPIGGVCRRAPWIGAALLPDLCFHDSASCEECAEVANKLDSGLHKDAYSPTGPHSYPAACLSSVTCSRPQDSNDLDFSSATESLRFSNFSLADASCATGYGGTVSAASCVIEPFGESFGTCERVNNHGELITVPFMSNSSCSAVVPAAAFVPESAPVSSVRGGAYAVSGCVKTTDALVSLRDSAASPDVLFQKWAAVDEAPCDGVAGITCLRDDNAEINALFGEHGLALHWDYTKQGGGMRCAAWPCAAPLLGAVGMLNKGAAIFGAFQSGFGAHQEDTILKWLGCPPGLGHVQGGIDVRTAEKMIAHECGVHLPRYDGNDYISLLDQCGGHSGASHDHTSRDQPDVLCEDHSETNHEHSPLIGRIDDGTPLGAPLYGRYTWNGDLPVLDACGGMFGPTPHSYGESVYHYHLQDGAPFAVGCFGPSYTHGDGTGAPQAVTLEECRALYDGCGDGDLIEVRFGPESGDIETYDPWCPCFDPQTGRNAGPPTVAFCDAKAACGSGIMNRTQGLTLECFQLISSVPRVPASVDRACDRCDPSPEHWEDVCIECVVALQEALASCTGAPALLASTMTRSFAVTRQDAGQHIRSCFDAKESGGCAMSKVQELCPVTCNNQLRSIASIGGTCVCQSDNGAEVPLCASAAHNYLGLNFSFCTDPLKTGGSKTGCDAIGNGCAWIPDALPAVVSKINLNAPPVCDYDIGSECDQDTLCSSKPAGAYSEIVALAFVASHCRARVRTNVTDAERCAAAVRESSPWEHCSAISECLFLTSMTLVGAKRTEYANWTLRSGSQTPIGTIDSYDANSNTAYVIWNDGAGPVTTNQTTSHYTLQSPAMCGPVDNGNFTVERPFFEVSALCSKILTLLEFEAGKWGNVNCNCGNTKSDPNADGWCPARLIKDHVGKSNSAMSADCVDARSDCAELVERWGDLACASDTPCPAACGTCPESTCTSNENADDDFDCTIPRCVGTPTNSSLRCAFPLLRLLSGTIRDQDCPAGCHFVPAGRLKYGSHKLVSPSHDPVWVRAEQCCLPTCAVNEERVVPAHPQIHHFNRFTARTGTNWSVVTVSNGCEVDTNLELGRCRAVVHGSLADAYCMGTDLHDGREWDSGMEGCYVTEQECQRRSSALRSPRTVLTPAEGSHGVGCSFQPADTVLQAELSSLSLEQLRLRAEYSGVDTVAVPQSIAASMVNMTKQAIIDLLVRELGSGCAPPKCRSPAGSISQIRSTLAVGWNASVFPLGVWTKLVDDPGEYDESRSTWGFNINTAECGPHGCGVFGFTHDGFAHIDTDGNSPPSSIVDPSLLREFACSVEDHRTKWVRDACPELSRKCLAEEQCLDDAGQIMFSSPNEWPSLKLGSLGSSLLVCIVDKMSETETSEEDFNDDPAACVTPCAMACQARFGQGPDEKGDERELCECYMQCQVHNCSNDVTKGLLEPTSGPSMHCLLHEVDEPCMNDDGCFSGLCEKHVPCDATTRAGCLEQSYAAVRDGFPMSPHAVDIRHMCLTEFEPTVDQMAEDNKCGACAWRETESYSNCMDTRLNTAGDGASCRVVSMHGHSVCSDATGLDTRPDPCLITGCFDGCLRAFSYGEGQQPWSDCSPSINRSSCESTNVDGIWCGLNSDAPRCEFGSQVKELSCTRNLQLYESDYAYDTGVPGICAAPDNRPPLAAIALPHGYYPGSHGTHSFISNSFGLFMNNLYQGGLRQRTVDGVVHSYYDSSSECDSACSDLQGESLCYSNNIGSEPGTSPVGGCTSSQIRVFVPDRGSDTLSAYAWSVHCNNSLPCDDFNNRTRREKILDDFLRAIVEGGISSEENITQHIIPGEEDPFTPSHLGPAYSVHLPDDGTAVLKGVVDVQHPHGASSSHGKDRAELGNGLIFPTRSSGQAGQWCGAHSDCESGVCSDPCITPSIHWPTIANSYPIAQPCLTTSEQQDPRPGFCQ